jgi:protein-tyrosine phosphatase
MIDPPTPLFQVALFITALNFIAQHHAQQRQVLIHCNQGRSRAPTLGLLYLAQTNLLPQDSYAVAAAAFRLTYMRDYQPGQGIQTFLTQNWNQLLQTTIQQV